MAARRGGRLELAEILALLLVAPVFWFPTRLPLLTLAVLPVLPALWAVRWRVRGRLTARLGFEAPLVFVLFATCVAAWPVTDWSLGLPKLLGMVLGAWTLVAVTNWVSAPRALDAAVLGLAALAMLLVVVGVLGTEWIPGKVPLLDPLYRRLPVLIRGVVPNSREGGIHPNELAGTLVLVAPPLLAQALVRGRCGWPWRWGPAGAGLLASLVLLVTQSRSGLGGFGVAALVGAGWMVWRHTTRWATAGPRLAARVGYLSVAVGAVVLAARLAGGWMAGASEATGRSALDTFQGRLELWQRGALMLQDFSFTGIGLGQFDVVFQRLYVPVLFAPDVYVPHAHDLFLEYALELGMPGFVAFGLVVLQVVRLAWGAARCAETRAGATAMGLLLGLLGFAVYGLTDAVAPGARAGLVLWVVLGLGAATPRR